MFPNVLMGRLTALQFTQKSIYTESEPKSIDVLRVKYLAPDGEQYHHDLPNGAYSITNKALQFMAKWGYQPSMLPDSRQYDARDDGTVIPIVYDANNEMDSDYVLAQTAMKGGQRLLSNAPWFGTDDDDDDDNEHHRRTDGGHNNDDNGGSGVVIKDGNDGQGINVHVS